MAMRTRNVRIIEQFLSLEVHLSYNGRQLSISVIPKNSDAIDKYFKPKIQDEKTVVKIFEGVSMNDSATGKLIIHNKCSTPAMSQAFASGVKVLCSVVCLSAHVLVGMQRDKNVNASIRLYPDSNRGYWNQNPM